ncbi:hypothetical protein Val02_04960 [Virgisporangium aliadipatigenens]|uniref:Uncharacterized protein n=1 Tax=Virgisporangium aliadipatigenens TaxID=741659 RepID=A0A8J3YGG4_9ACTN|nr:hypothetical protein [Virgisporangium aliadipatigenens]GIJ43610.1 hypothetical protein Val02_04960 [Virgisporangium aliadipatigenens]
MSWSTFSYGEHWAHAHDVQQEAFMALASLYVAADPALRRLPWLHAWRAVWDAEVGAQGNGCTSLRAEEHLAPQDVPRFLDVLAGYRRWLSGAAGGASFLTGVDVDKLTGYTHLVAAVLTGDETHPGVRRRPS